MDIADVIRGRASKFEGIANLEPFIRTMNRALTVHEAVHAQHATVAKDGKLTALGRQAEMRRHVAEKAAPHLYQSQKSVALLSAKVAAWRSRLQPPAPDKADASRAVLRADARVMLRGMSVSARAALLLADDADPLLIEAALEAPAALSGLTNPIREQLLESYLEKNHGPELRKIEEADAALELATVAVQVSTTTLRAACEFHNDMMFAEFIETALGKEKAANIVLGVGQEFGGALQS